MIEKKTICIRVAPEGGWTPEAIIAKIRTLPEDQLRRKDAIKLLGEGIIRAAYRTHGTWRRAVEATGFRYPGSYVWRIKYYREDPNRFQQDFGKIPVEKMKGTWAFCKEAGLPIPEPPVIHQAKLCKLCQTDFAPIGHIYCESCRKIMHRVRARARMRRWLKTPKGQAWKKKHCTSQGKTAMSHPAGPSSDRGNGSGSNTQPQEPSKEGSSITTAFRDSGQSLIEARRENPTDKRPKLLVGEKKRTHREIRKSPGRSGAT